MKELYPWQYIVWQHMQGVRKRLPNALLLKGSEGIGKLDLALSFAQSILCNSNLPDGFACQDCPSCHWFKQETHPDFKFIQPESLIVSEDTLEKEGAKKASSEISVDQIRGLTNFVNLSAHNGGYRVILLHPAEAMNSNSANALLKALEEPTGNLLFILVTHKPQQLLATILSRCFSIAAPVPSFNESMDWLRLNGVADPNTVLSRTNFAPLLALQSSTDDKNSEEYKLILSAIKMADRFEATLLAEQLSRSAPIQLIHFLQQWCYDLLSYKLAHKIRYYPQFIDLITELAGNLPLQVLLRYLKELQIARREAFHPLNPKLLFESILLGYQQLFRSKN